MKIDVDGAELAVVESMRRTLSEHCPTVLIETHSAALEAGCIHAISRHPYRATVVRNARWRSLYPEWRPIMHNRWLLREPL